MTESREPTTLESVDRGIRLYWRTLGKARQMEAHTGDIDYVMSRPRGGQECIFNLRLAPETIGQRLAEIAAGMRARELPGCILIPPGAQPSNLAQILVLKGFQIDSSGLYMAADPANLPRLDLPAGPIQTKAVDDPDLLRCWIEVVNSALTGDLVMSFDQFQDIYSQKNTHFYLGVYEGTPAATAMLVSEDGVATLELVSTLPGFRRRGLGTAVTMRALQAMRDQGVKVVILGSEPDAIRLYQRVGFREVCKRLVASVFMG